jgi:hypothetical protein
MPSGARAGLSRRAVVVAAAVLIHPSWLLAQPSTAEPGSDEAVRLTEAERACLEGSFQRGIQLLAELYLASRHPAYLHNQARCYEQNGQYRQAAGRYREFLLKLQELPPGARTEDTKLPAEKVAAIEARAAKLEQLGFASAPPPAEPPPAATLVEREPAGPPPSVPSAGGGAGWRGTGVALLALGGLGLAGSGVLGLRARQAERDISEASSQGGRTYDPDRYRTGERAARMATVGFIAAPAAAVVGALLYWRGASLRTRKERAHLQLLPTIARGGLGGLVAVSY